MGTEELSKRTAHPKNRGQRYDFPRDLQSLTLRPPGASDFPEGLVQVGDQVIHMLRADRQADGTLEDSLVRQFGRDFTSATFARREKISSASMNR